MKPKRRTILAGAAALAACGLLPAPGAAQSWPSQRVTILVPFAAGSITDILARIFADDMSKRWRQQVVVENRPGMAGMAAAAKAAPNGYTLLMTTNAHSVTHLVSKEAPFHPLNDFTGLTRMATGQIFLIAHPGSGLRTLRDVIERAKREPDKLSFSSPGLASTVFLVAILFRKAAGISLVHVPFRGAPEAVTAVMRGDVQLAFAPINLTREQSAAGNIIAIGTPSERRVPELPDVPTFAEAGLPFFYETWSGLVAPAGTPPAVLDKIAKDWADAANTPEVQARMKSQFLRSVSDTPDAHNRMIREDTTALTQLFKEMGL